MKFRRPAILTALCTLLVTTVATAAEPTVLDVARAFLRFEQALQAHPLEQDEATPVGIAFDRAANAYFAGQTVSVIRQIDDLTLQRAFPDAPNLEHAAAISLRAEATPSTWHPGMTEPVRLRIDRVYPVTAVEGDLQCHLVMGDERVESWRIPHDMIDGWRVDVHAETLPAGDAHVMIETPDGATFAIGEIAVLATDPAAALDVSQFDAIDHPALGLAVDLCRSRIEMALSDAFEDRITRGTRGPATTITAVIKEFAALLASRNPYRQATGHLWYRVPTNRDPIACRVYCPPGIEKNRLPVIVAMHGAGGNEHMFAESYGGAVGPDLADEHGFLLISPSTYGIMANPKAFPMLLDHMESLYNIDRSRVYVMGHSLGGMTTSVLATRDTALIAAACGIAGGTPPRASSTTPMRIYAAERDIVIPLRRLQPPIEKAQQAGRNVELRIVEDHAHILVVGAVLPEAVEWLLQHERVDGAVEVRDVAE